MVLESYIRLKPARDKPKCHMVAYNRLVITHDIPIIFSLYPKYVYIYCIYIYIRYIYIYKYIYTYLYNTPPRYKPIIFTVYPSVTSPLRYLLLSAVLRTTSSSGRGWWTTPGLHGLRRSSTSACRRLDGSGCGGPGPYGIFLGSFPTWWNLAIPTFSLWWSNWLYRGPKVFLLIFLVNEVDIILSVGFNYNYDYIVVDPFAI